MDHHKREFEEEGYTIFRGYFSEAEMSGLIDNIRNSKTKSGEPSGLNKGTLTFYSNIFYYTESVQKFVSQERIIELLTPIMGPDIWIRWDQAVLKGPGSGEFPWHQDNGYSGLLDQHFQLWIALSPMTHENGGLWLKPGSHKKFLPHTSVGNHMVCDEIPDDPVFIDAEPGDVVLFSSYTLHQTRPNLSQSERWAYVVEYMSLDHFDPTISPPYLQIARNGVPDRKFMNYYRGRLNPLNHLKYLQRRLERTTQRISNRARRTTQNVLVR